MESGVVNVITEVHRGCSTFIQDTLTCAHIDYDHGNDYAVCKETCSSKGNYACNSMKYPTEDDIECECPVL